MKKMVDDVDLKPVIAVIEARKVFHEQVKADYEAKEKIKALTTAERLDRIERLLRLDK